MHLSDHTDLVVVTFQGKGLSHYFIPQVSLRVSLTHLNTNYLSVFARSCRILQVLQYHCANVSNFFYSSR